MVLIVGAIAGRRYAWARNRRGRVGLQTARDVHIRCTSRANCRSPDPTWSRIADLEGLPYHCPRAGTCTTRPAARSQTGPRRRRAIREEHVQHHARQDDGPRSAG